MGDLPRENVQEYPRPPALQPVADQLRVLLNGTEIASTRAGFRVLETHHPPSYYIPPGDIRPGALRPASGRTFCEWKGFARYFDVISGDRVEARAAWAYPDPTEGFHAIADYVSFYPGRMEACYVGDVRVIPQPGDFYGGWVTPNLDGIVKGGPGTEGW